MPTSARSRRRTQRRGDLKEQAILDTAERLFSERGLGDVSVDELSRGAGISRPSFYFYFRSKDDVLLALVDRIAVQMQAETDRWLQRVDLDPRAAIESSIRGTAVYWRQHTQLIRGAVAAWGTVPALRRIWGVVVERFAESSARHIDEARAAGQAPPGPDALALATTLMWMNERCFSLMVLEEGPLPEEDELVRTLAEVWVRSIYGECGELSPPPPAP